MTTTNADLPGGQVDPVKTEKALKLFKIAAVVVGIGLLVLVVEMILKYGFDNGALDWWPQPHGLLFLLYVGATANLSFKARWGLGRMIMVILAGCVPFLSFWMERRVSAMVERQLGALRSFGDVVGTDR